MAADTTKKQQGRPKTTGRSSGSTKNTSRGSSTTKRSTGTGSKNGTGTRRSQTNTRGTQLPKDAPKTENKILKEAIVLIMIAFSLILFITNFGVGGVVGKAVSSFFFGLFGLVAYIFPIVLIVGGLLLVSNYKNSVVRIKIITSFVIMILLCTLIQLISGNHADEWSFGDYYINSFANKNGGGLLGGFLCKLLCMGFGTIGAYILDIVFIIIGIVVISEHSFISGLKKGGKKVYNTARNDVEQYRENAEERRKIREEAKLERASRKVKGVSTDTEILREDVYNFESAQAEDEASKSRRKKKTSDIPENTGDADGNIIAFNKDKYENLADVTDYATKHYEEEQSGAFEPYTGEDILSDSDGFVDTQLIKEELKKKDTATKTKSEPASFLDTPYQPVYENADNASDKKITAYEKSSDSDNLYSERGYSENLTEEVMDNPYEDTDNIQDIEADGMAPVEEYVSVPPIEKPKKPERYFFPPLTLLKQGDKNAAGTSQEELRVTASKLQQTLANFGVKVTVTDVSCGPSVTRYELQPEQGVKVSKIVSLADDIKLNLAAADIRIEAPIPGKAAVGIEVPNKVNTGVMLGDLIRSREFKANSSKIAFAAGMDIAGQTVLADIAKMPHLLIAGATGSGKSVCINTIIMSILYRAKPDEVKLIMIDPKVVELSVYNGIPHLMIPVVTDPKKAAAALAWAVTEMSDRYNKFAEYSVRDMKGYNDKVEALTGIDEDKRPAKMPQIVIIIDELADLMMVSSSEVEDAIVRLAQLARAAGIHLVIATQRPSVNVITGLIKANVPSRIAFSVSSGVDSRTILDMYGAEKLLGKGDMLFYPQGYQKPARVQGAFVSDEEVTAVVDYLKSHCEAAQYSEAVANHISNPGFEESKSVGGERDQYFAEAGRFIIEKERASIGMLQRLYKIGFNRAARIMDQLAEAGVVGPEEGTKPRKVLMTMDEFNNYLSKK